MRLHDLTVTAFGPFAGTERVDFDELCDAGLFLLTGPTGAGKTTLLDAVCFALYGSVPGVRGVKALKSQHAPAEARPEVVLDFSVRERRFVVRRSPEWSRPKRRGTGFTTENARATLVETTSGEEHLLSSRAQEIGHFVGELVGMQSTQFVQVAMLPQGEFQKFLRAPSQDRHDVLQHLFRTDRYAHIEDWVQEHSRTLAERSASGRQQVVRVLDTVADRVRGEVPLDLHDDSLLDAEVRGQAVTWLDGLLAEAEAALLDAELEAVAAATRTKHAREARDQGLRVHELQVRRADALAVLAELDRESASVVAARAALDADDRAARCLPLVKMLDEAADHQDAVTAAWSRARERLGRLEPGERPLPDPLTVPALTALDQQARTTTARLESLLPREEQLRTARLDLRAVEEDLQRAETARSETSGRTERLTHLLTEARSEMTQLATHAARAEALTLELEQARARHVAASDAQACAQSLAALRDVERDARDNAADARERVHELTARRLAGIAAELAGQLADGESCQVCGSTEHPAPATHNAPHVTEAEQQAANTRFDAAALRLTQASTAVAQAQEKLAGLRTVAMQKEPAETAGEVTRLETVHGAALEAARALEVTEETVAQLLREQADLTTEQHGLALRVASATQAAEALRLTIERLSAELAQELEDGQAPLHEQIEAARRWAEDLAQARDALVAHEAAVTRTNALHDHVLATAHEHGFPGVDPLRQAILTPGSRADLGAMLEKTDAAQARARTTLEDPEIRDLPAGPLPDLALLESAAAAAEEQAASTATTQHRAAELCAALRRQRSRLVTALEGWAPVREEFARAESMAKLVRGMGSDNQLQMRLSAYVLATRLDQVVDAANERLGQMRDQRYLLRRTGRAARKGSRAGLGLEVVDQWTGDVREPTTLSGGETFVVSLSLALGLADVVTQEAGGTEIETLFVDEGFGTLDADTLDDVMDRLDELRAGGRAVGVVSHVAELRNRIPTQLHVEKHRTGSVVAVRTAVG